MPLGCSFLCFCVLFSPGVIYFSKFRPCSLLAVMDFITQRSTHVVYESFRFVACLLRSVGCAPEFASRHSGEVPDDSNFRAGIRYRLCLRQSNMTHHIKVVIISIVHPLDIRIFLFRHCSCCTSQSCHRHASWYRPRNAYTSCTLVE